MSFVMYSQMEMRYVWEPIVRGGTVPGRSGGSGASVHDPVEWVSSRGSEPSSAPGPMAHGVRTSLEGIRNSASVTSGPAEVSQPEQHVELSCDFQFNPFSDFHSFQHGMKIKL